MIDGRVKMKAEAKSLRFLGESNKLSVPFFQRRYVWDEENWGELVENLENSEVTPFLGSLILKEQSGNEFSVIDGQQRLTTITILAKAIYDSLPNNAKEPGSGVRNGIENFLFYRSNAADDFKDSHIKIEHSRLDNRDYTRVIKAEILGEPKIDLDTINENSSNVLQCYKYYRERFEVYGIDKLKSLFTQIFDGNRRVLIVIELGKDDVNEQTIFDTINRAGVRLSAADIIKNNLFKRLLDESGKDETLKEKVITTYKDCWEEVFSKTQDICDVWDEERVFGNVKHSNLEFLLYSVACIKWGEDGDMFPKLESVYNRETANMNFADLLALTNDIKDYANIFAEYVLKFKSEMEDESKSIYFKYNDNVNRLLLILQKFKVQMFYPYIIKRLYEENQDVSNEKLISDFAKLESFVVRRKLSNKGTHDYTSKCYNIIKNGIDSLVESDLSNPDSGISDADIKRFLAETKDDTAKMILFCIELYRRKDDSVDVNALEYKYTLEHIMPKKWDTYWSDVPIIEGDKTLDPESEEGKQFRKRTIESIGNKTLLTCNLNSAIRNANYDKKVLGDGEKKPGYKLHTMLLLTKDIVECYESDSIWDEKHIAQRLEELYQEFLCLWPSYCDDSIQTESVVKNSNDNSDPDLSIFTDDELADPMKVFDKVSLNNDVNSTNTIVDISNMYSQLELIKHMSVNSTHTIRKYIAEGKIVPDAVVKTSDKRSVNYYKKERIQEFSEKYGWEIISEDNIMSLFLEMISKMRMDHSYKPVFLKCFFGKCDSDGKAFLSDVASEFDGFYTKRRNDSLKVEKDDSLFCKQNYFLEDVKKQILNHPFKRFELMNMMRYDSTSGYIELDSVIWNQLSTEERNEICLICDMNIEQYYKTLNR